jgi:hypothetical protein
MQLGHRTPSAYTLSASYHRRLFWRLCCHAPPLEALSSAATASPIQAGRRPRHARRCRKKPHCRTARGTRVSHPAAGRVLNQPRRAPLPAATSREEPGRLVRKIPLLPTPHRLCPVALAGSGSGRGERGSAEWRRLGFHLGHLDGGRREKDEVFFPLSSSDQARQRQLK